MCRTHYSFWLISVTIFLLIAANSAQSRTEDSLLETILASGELRIGTTGDYPPFSYREPNSNQLTGIDIELATHLANSLGVKPKFIPTSWPTLMSDFKANKFHIAMSGITRKLSRAKLAYFSDPYFQNGKTPIVRCSEGGRFNSLAAINRPEVRVIVNPGGTNQQFANIHITQAQLTVFDDNTRIFEQIIQGQADVMITDAVEVQYQSALNPVLCPAMPGQTFTRSVKAFMLIRDSDWKAYVDIWLAEVKLQGVLTDIRSRFLP